MLGHTIACSEEALSVTPSAVTSVSILDLLRRDHRDCDALLAQMRERLDGDTPGDSAAFEAFAADFARLRQTLQQHYLREEYGLFPLLHQYRTMVLLQVEHDDITEHENALEAALSAGAEHRVIGAETRACFQRFCDRLQAHVREEETGVFMLAESVLEPEEKALAARKYQEIAEAVNTCGEPPVLERPQPVMQVHPDSVFDASERPIVYATVFQEEQASVQRLWLAAGAALTRHWSAQHQYMVLLRGAVTLTTDHDTTALTPGQSVSVSPRFAFSLAASEDSCLMVTKVWPRPHFRRVQR